MKRFIMMPVGFWCRMEGCEKKILKRVPVEERYSKPGNAIRL
jgi:hypothetical protein